MEDKSIIKTSNFYDVINKLTKLSNGVRDIHLIKDSIGDNTMVKISNDKYYEYAIYKNINDFRNSVGDCVYAALCVMGVDGLIDNV